MQRQHLPVLAALFGISFIIAADLVAQDPAPAQPPAAGRAARGRGGRGGAAGASGTAGPSGAAAPGLPAIGRGGAGGAAYPPRPPADPAVAARGKAIFDASCSKCHASDLRGTPTGINLVRNQMVLDDQAGEMIGRFLGSPHAKGQAAKMDLTSDQVHDLAIYMHTFQNYRAIVTPPDINSAILAAGDAKAGQAYFAAHCASCHSVTGDLQGIGTKYSEPRTLQNTIVSGGGAGGRGGGRGGGGGAGSDAAPSRRTITVTLTMANGQKLEGRLVTYDDFLVTFIDSEGTQRTIRRNDGVPKVEVHDPMKAHRDMLLTFQDSDIHNLTAYLVTIK